MMQAIQSMFRKIKLQLNAQLKLKHIEKDIHYEISHPSKNLPNIEALKKNTQKVFLFGSKIKNVILN